MTVRNHSRPCEHGSLWPHWIDLAEARWWKEPECPGGAAIRLRRVSDGVWAEVREEESEPTAS